MPGTKPDKKELAKFKVMSELGLSPHAIGAKIGRSKRTVAKYLKSDVYLDPSIAEIVEKIKEKELNDLYLLGAKGRARLHELLDEGDSQMIPTIALVDRMFQQRRLLEGSATQIIDHSLIYKDITHLEKRLGELGEEERKLLEKNDGEKPPF